MPSDTSESRLPLTHWPNLTIRRLVSLLIAAIALPLMALLGFSLYRDLNNEYTEAFRIANLLSDTTAKDTAHFLATTKKLATQLAERPKVRALDPRHCDEFALSLLPLLVNVTNIFTVDDNGRLLCSAIPITAKTPRSVPRQYWLEELQRSGMTTVGHPAHGFISGKWVSTIAQPIFDSNGKFSGGLGIAVELARYRPLQTQEDQPEGTAIRIIDSSGIVVASMQNDDLWVGRDVSDHEMIKTVLARRQGTVHMPGLDGVDRLTSFRSVPGSNWLVIAGVPASFAFAQFEKYMLNMLLALAAAAGSAAGLGIWLGSRVTRPLRALATSAQAVAKGNFAVRSQVAGPRDVAAVALQFNRMLDAQAQSTAALRQSEAHLRLFLENSPAALAMLDRDMRYIAVSHRWLSDYQLGDHNIIGLSHYEVFPDIPERWKDIHRRCLVGSPASSEQDSFLRTDGRTEWLRWAILPWHTHDGTVGGIVIFTEVITQRVRAQAMFAAAQTVLDGVARGADLPVVLDRLVRATEGQAHQLLCSILLLDDDGKHLWHGAAPNLPAGFVQAIDGGEIGPRAGSCGTAAFRKERVIVEDIASDPLWADYRELALRHGLHACWSTPVFGADGRVVATFACYYRRPRPPSDFHLQLVGNAIDLASVAISRWREAKSLRDSSAELQMLSRRLVEAEAGERRRLAAELHDRVGPNLTSLAMNLQIIEIALPPGAKTAVSPRFDDARRLLEQATGELRSVMHDLRPAELDDFGLKTALGFYAEQAGARAGFSVQISGVDALPPLSIGVETVLYRIGQEAVTNVSKHASASKLTIDFTLSESHLVFSIADDGRGLPRDIEAGTRGLRSMRERALSIGAHLTIEALPGGGTRLVVTLDGTAAATSAANA
jgi:PAS domain S-box-containing protein